MKAIKILPYVFSVFLLTACASSKPINTLNHLSGNSWALASLLGEGLDMTQFPGGIPSLSFLADGTLSGFTGCNNFSGDFSIDYSRLQLDLVAMSKKMCPGIGERDFIAALSKVGSLK
ncbi:MAG: META domain-containing protein, partial [Algoriphagus sp.]